MKTAHPASPGEGHPELEDETVVVAQAKGHPFDDLGFLVDALEEADPLGESAVAQDAVQAGLAAFGESPRRLVPAAEGAFTPLFRVPQGVPAGDPDHMSCWLVGPQAVGRTQR